MLHRVVCCYPDYERLLGAAADHARTSTRLQLPPRNAISRLFVALQNVAFRAMREEFRTFAHPPAAMLEVLRAHRLNPAYDHKQLVSEVTGLAGDSRGSRAGGQPRVRGRPA